MLSGKKPLTDELRRQIKKVHQTLTNETDERTIELLNLALSTLREHSLEQDEDWRLLSTTLSELQHYLKNPDLLKEAIQSLLTVKTFSQTDWRNLSLLQYNLSLVSAEEERLELALAAVENMTNVHTFKTGDYFDLADYQYNVGLFTSDVDQKFAWFQKAIATVLKKPDLGDAELEKLAYLQFKSADVFDDKNIKLIFFAQVKESLSQIKKMSPNAIRLASEAYDAIGRNSNDDPHKKWHDKAVKIRLMVGENHLTDDDFRSLSTYYYNAGCAYKKLFQFNDSERCFTLSLWMLLKITNKKSIDFKYINDVYQEFESLTLDDSGEQKFYQFASDVFSNTPRADIKLDFYKCHYFISKINDATLIHQHFYQFMLLIENVFQHPNFANKNVSNWLKDPNELKQFQKIIAEMQEYSNAYDSFQHIIGNRPVTWLAISQKLLAQDTAIKKLAEEVELLKGNRSKSNDMEIDSEQTTTSLHGLFHKTVVPVIEPNFTAVRKNNNG